MFIAPGHLLKNIINVRELGAGGRIHVGQCWSKGTLTNRKGFYKGFLTLYKDWREATYVCPNRVRERMLSREQALVMKEETRSSILPLLFIITLWGKTVKVSWDFVPEYPESYFLESKDTWERKIDFFQKFHQRW